MLRKRLFVAGLILVLVLLGNAAALFATGTQEEETQDGKVAIEVWHRWSGNHDKIFQEMVAAFAQQNPSVEVNPTSIAGEYANLVQKALAQIAAGQEPPAIIAPGYFLLDYTLNTFGGVDLNKLGGKEAKQAFKDYRPALLNLGNFNKVQYALPLAVSVQTLFYNEDIYEAAGLDPSSPPATWDAVYDLGKKIKANTDRSALFISTPDSWYMQALVESNGGRFLVDGKAAFDTPDAVEVMEMWRKFYAEGLIPKISYAESKRAFQAGEIAMHGISIMNLGTMSQTADWLRVAPMPTFGGKKKRQPAGGAGLMVIARKDDQQKGAWEFLKFIGTPEAMDIWTKTGYVSVLQAPAELQDQRQQAAYDQLDNVIRWVNWPGPRGLEAEGIIAKWRDMILYGEVDAASGLQQAVSEINTILAQ